MGKEHRSPFYHDRTHVLHITCQNRTIVRILFALTAACRHGFFKLQMCMVFRKRLVRTNKNVRSNPLKMVRVVENTQYSHLPANPPVLYVFAENEIGTVRSIETTAFYVFMPKGWNLKPCSKSTFDLSNLSAHRTRYGWLAPRYAIVCTPHRLLQT